jgi:hypothetical protein
MFCLTGFWQPGKPGPGLLLNAQAQGKDLLPGVNLTLKYRQKACLHIFAQFTT